MRAKKDAVPSPAASPAATMSEDEKAIYALGAAMGQQVAQQLTPLNLSTAELETLKKGLHASLAGEKPLYDIQQYGPKLQARAQAQAAAFASGEKEKSAAFRDAAAAEAGAVKTRLRARLQDDQARHRPDAQGHRRRERALPRDAPGRKGVRQLAAARQTRPSSRSTSVIPCWTEGVQRMKVGETAKLVCPSEIAYGDGGRGPDIPPGATLVFEVELLAIKGR